MQCVILAGGLGTRLRSVTATMPKALVPVAGRPFADHQLTWLKDEGVTNVVYSVGHLGDQIREHVGDGARYGLSVRYVDEGADLRGTGGALRLAYDEGALEPTFGVLYGDSYLTAPLSAVAAEFARRRPAGLMTVYRNENRFDTSNARLSDGWVVAYDKAVDDPVAAGMLWIDYGFSMYERDEIIPLLPAADVVDLAVVQRTLSKQGRLAGYEVTERFYEVGSPEGLAELETFLTPHLPEEPAE
jgi:MurNAc alpha-1-phosphate uridylyltransferase